MVVHQKAMVTDMSTPLGRSVGNALEMREIIEFFDGTSAADLDEIVMTAASLLLSLSDLDISRDEAAERARAVMQDGSAKRMFNAWIEAQGGDLAQGLPEAPEQYTVIAKDTGIVTKVDALTVGTAAAHLGAGRQTKDDAVDHAVGIWLHKSVGEAVEEGDPLFTVHARTEVAARRAADSILGQLRIDRDDDAEPFERTVVIEQRG